MSRCCLTSSQSNSLFNFTKTNQDTLISRKHRFVLTSSFLSLIITKRTPVRSCLTSKQVRFFFCFSLFIFKERVDFKTLGKGFPCLIPNDKRKKNSRLPERNQHNHIVLCLSCFFPNYIYWHELLHQLWHLQFKQSRSWWISEIQEQIRSVQKDISTSTFTSTSNNI